MEAPPQGRLFFLVVGLGRGDVDLVFLLHPFLEIADPFPHARGRPPPPLPPREERRPPREASPRKRSRPPDLPGGSFPRSAGRRSGPPRKGPSHGPGEGVSAPP